MRDFLKQRVGRPSAGWLWPLALLALPNCAQIADIEDWDPEAAAPTTAVFCDIPKPPPAAPLCIKPDEIPLGIRQASAAVALNTGDTGTTTIDESETALAACAATTGGPQAVEFLSVFPNGKGGCTDPALTDANAFCVTLCNQITDNADPGFCSSHAHASTNVPLTGFPGGCTPEGSLSVFVDPRPTPEKVDWDPLSLTGVTPLNGNGLLRTADTSPPFDNPPFDAGAASTQRIEHGDAYVEFSAGQANLMHVIGLSEIPDANVCPPPCTDTDPSLTDITFGISLSVDGNVYVVEKGVPVLTGPGIQGSFGPYAPNERFRVSVRQSADGTKTATVTYSRMTATCFDANPCPADVFYTHDGVANYPLRVDTSFREVNAFLNDVTVVRIK